MMRVLKYIAITLLSLVLLVCVAVGGAWAWTSRAIARTVPLPTHDFSAPADAAAITRGEHFVRAIGKCGDCHGQDFGGLAVMDDPAFGMLYAPNLTTGRGGQPADQAPATWERAVRHGLAADGRRLMLMPSQEFQHISDADLGDIIAYLKSLPAVDRDRPAHRVGPVARGLYLAGILPMFPYDVITHGDQVIPGVPADTTAAYGRYLGDIGCSGCHGVTYGGGAIPGGPPDWPPPANLTPTGLGRYTLATFTTALREGKRPDGSAINPFMPITATKLMTDTEIRAVWNYLQTLPPREFGSR